jgi:hypothetical protein
MEHIRHCQEEERIIQSQEEEEEGGVCGVAAALMLGAGGACQAPEQQLSRAIAFEEAKEYIYPDGNLSLEAQPMLED